MRTLIILGATIILSATLYVTHGVAGPAQSASPAAAQEPHDHEHGATARPEAQAPQRGMRGGMMAKKNATDDDLSRLAATMNAATGDAKIAAMADLLTRLVQQQAAANESMKAMKSQCAMMKDGAHIDVKPGQ